MVVAEPELLHHAVTAVLMLVFVMSVVASATWTTSAGKLCADLYADAIAHYDKALAINPKHKGALEYKGELYLTLGNLAGAEELLARLNKTCSFNCSEVRDLKDAIAAYKKAQ